MNIQSKTVLRVIGVLIYICFFSLWITLLVILILFQEKYQNIMISKTLRTQTETEINYREPKAQALSFFAVIHMQ
jgi:hypothetical protein